MAPFTASAAGPRATIGRALTSAPSPGGGFRLAGRVNVRSLPPPRRGGSSVRLPFLPRDATAYAAAKARAAQGRPGRKINASLRKPISEGRAGSPDGGGTDYQVLTNFPAMSHDVQIAACPNGLDAEPPDTQLAAGLTRLLEMDNSTGSIWTKTGTMTDCFDLNDFFLVFPGYSFSDPRVLYDPVNNRWFASGVSFRLVGGTYDSQAHIAVSETSDPAGFWDVYYFDSPGVIDDQPMIGTNLLDKVVISWNDFNGTTLQFIEAETWVLQLSGLLAGTIPAAEGFADPNAFRVVPAISLARTGTAWGVFNGGGFIGVWKITGTAAAGNVTITEYLLPRTSTSVPPAASQPGGPPTIDTGDDRLLSAVWTPSNVIWMGGNDGCIPPPGAATQSCLRVNTVSTAAATPTLGFDEELSQLGADLYYPAVAVDSFGNALFTYSESSTSMNASAVVVDRIAGAASGSFGVPTIVGPGLGRYTGTRWGDYSGAAVDPTNPADVWLTAEYKASATANKDWGTEAARVAVLPILSSVTPGTGPTSGGQCVTIDGRNIQPAATVDFGGSTGTTNQKVGNGLVVSTPPGAAGPPVNVTLTNPDGTTATLPASYTYGGALIAPAPTAGVPPAAVGNAAPAFDLFDLKAADGTVEHTWDCGPGWSNTENLGSPVSGALVSAPSVSEMNAPQLQVFGRGFTNALMERARDASGTWGPWTSIGGALTSRPAAVSWGGGRIDVFVRGSDTHLWHRWFSGGGWSGWQNLFGVIPAGASPAAASMASNRLEIFVRGTDNAVWEKTWNGLVWSGWKSLGGVIQGDPSAASPTATQLRLFVRGSDSALWYKYLTGAVWSKFFSLPGVALTSDPAASATTAGAPVPTTAVFALSGAAIWQIRDAGGWGSWSQVP
jgi:hypothetical protein